MTDRNSSFYAVDELDGIFRAELEQGAQRFGRRLAGAGLGVPAGEDEHRHQGGDFEVDLVPACLRGANESECHRHPGHAGATEEQGVQRPPERGDHPDTDERVHGRGAVSGIDRRGTMERPCSPYRHRGGEGERQPLPELELQRGNHRQHRDRHRQSGADQQTLPQRNQIAVHRRTGFTRSLDDRRRRKRRLVAGGFDRRDQCGRIDVLTAHASLLGGVVDGRFHTRQLVELPLDPRRTRRAGHPGDVELDIDHAHDGLPATA